MKYSFLMPYITSRIPQYRETLRTFDRFYFDRSDYEICLTMSDYCNPCVAFNQAALRAQGDFFILTSPECKHETNVLAGFDEELKKYNNNCYIVCACESIESDGSKQWYQHSVYNNRQYHFCTCISKKNWMLAGGFCEFYKYGQGFDDDDWIERVRRTNIPIINRDDLLVAHQNHGKIHLSFEQTQINCNLYNLIWNKNRVV